MPETPQQSGNQGEVKPEPPLIPLIVQPVSEEKKDAEPVPEQPKLGTPTDEKKPVKRVSQDKSKEKKSRAKRISEDKTLVKVKAMRRLLKEEGKKVGYQIRISPEFIDAFDTQVVRKQFYESIVRMKKSKCKTLLAQHV